MKLYGCLLMLCCLLWATVAGAQNLVLNPSFEEYHICPKQTDELMLVKNWHNPSETSPDYYNVCCNNNKEISVPNNLIGYQIPKSGDAYAGIINYSQKDNSYHEYLQTKLKQKLTAGKQYEISIYVSLSDSSQYYYNTFTFCFTDTNYVLRTNKSGEYHVLICNRGVTVTNDSISSDCENWHLIKGVYTAQGGEQYLTIGCFKADISKKQYKRVRRKQKTKRGDRSYAYYYVDDISLVDISNKNSYRLIDNSN